MNERIRELAEQADAYADAMDVGGKNYIGLRDEYFTKLIVKECIDILKRPDFIMRLSQTELSDYNQGWINGRLLAIERIKEHFGNENE